MFYVDNINNNHAYASDQRLDKTSIIIGNENYIIKLVNVK